MKQEVSLGGHPTFNMLKFALIALGGTIALVGALYFVNGFVAFLIGLMAAAVWTFALGPALLVKIVSSFGYAAMYKTAQKLVSDGQLIPSFVGRNPNCEGVAVVDEKNKQIYVNGTLYKFSEIKAIESRTENHGRRTQHFVRIIIKHGASPMQNILFDSGPLAQSFYYRLTNSLGFS